LDKDSAFFCFLSLEMRMKLLTANAFKNHTASIEKTPGYRKPLAFGICRTYRGQLHPKQILACDFPVVNWDENFGSAAVFQDLAGLADSKDQPEAVVPISYQFVVSALESFSPFVHEARGEKHKNVQALMAIKQLCEHEKRAIDRDFSLVVLYKDAPPQSVPATYLKLLARSMGKAPLDVNLDEIFKLLPNVAWAERTPYEPEYLEKHRIEMAANGTRPTITRFGNLPLFLDHLVPPDGTPVSHVEGVPLGTAFKGGQKIPCPQFG
jgi:2,3,4,5-tetrahydropyridine-2-carboxylate N-succinyltransferase